MFKLLALIALVVGFVVALVDPSDPFVMPALEWFVLGIGLALLEGLSPTTARKL
jgi:hypothetical protein